jgi:hypothetical protein
MITLRGRLEGWKSGKARSRDLADRDERDLADRYEGDLADGYERCSKSRIAGLRSDLLDSYYFPMYNL